MRQAQRAKFSATPAMPVSPVAPNLSPRDKRNRARAQERAWRPRRHVTPGGLHDSESGANLARELGPRSWPMRLRRLSELCGRDVSGGNENSRADPLRPDGLVELRRLLSLR